MCKHTYGVALYPPTSGGGFTPTEDKKSLRQCDCARIFLNLIKLKV
ncbi:hypothetical protein ENHYDAX1_60273 [Enhydrobacter sp. AX1]|nr:hypothetical protein ENHYDAX1_60273 [Enhydrobacter sp. AX1]